MDYMCRKQIISYIIKLYKCTWTYSKVCNIHTINFVVHVLGTLAKIRSTTCLGVAPGSQNIGHNTCNRHRNCPLVTVLTFLELKLMVKLVEICHVRCWHLLKYHLSHICMRSYGNRYLPKCGHFSGCCSNTVLVHALKCCFFSMQLRMWKL